MTMDYREYLNEQLKNPEFSMEYDVLETEFAVIQALIDARHEADAGIQPRDSAQKPRR